MWALVLGFFMILVDATIVSIATPAIMAAFGADVDAVVGLPAPTCSPTRSRC